MASEGETVVGGVDDDRVVGEAAGFEGGEEAADLGVEVFDHRVVFGELVADHRFGAGPGAEVFVATAGHGAVVKGELREKVFREGRAGGVVGGKAGRGLARIVGSGVGDVAEERLRARGRVMLVDKLDGGVGEQLGGEAGAEARAGQFAVGGAVVERDLGVIGHAAEHHALAVLEGAEPGGLAVVPFAGAEGGVAVLAEEFAHEFLAGERLGVHGEPGFSGVEHGAARHADGAAVAAEDVVVAEADAVAGEAVDDGRLDVRVAVGGDGVGALVVGEEEKDVGLRGAGGGGRCGGKGEQEREGAEQALHGDSGL